MTVCVGAGCRGGANGFAIGVQPMGKVGVAVHRLAGGARPARAASNGHAPTKGLRAVPWFLALMTIGLAAPTNGYAAGNMQHDAAAVSAALRDSSPVPAPQVVALPPPALTGAHDLARLLRHRRSVREFAPTPLQLAQIGQLLWAAQGITSASGQRAAPSAGALYPIELYIIAGEVEGLAAGIYHYDPPGHRLTLIERGDRRRAVAAAATQQLWLAAAPTIIVFGAVHARTGSKYGHRADRFVSIEVGHAAENLFLQAVDLGLGTADVGAFDDAEMLRVLQLPRDVAPLLLMPVGVPR